MKGWQPEHSSLAVIILHRCPSQCTCWRTFNNRFSVVQMLPTELISAIEVTSLPDGSELTSRRCLWIHLQLFSNCSLCARHCIQWTKQILVCPFGAYILSCERIVNDWVLETGRERLWEKVRYRVGKVLWGWEEMCNTKSYTISTRQMQ